MESFVIKLQLNGGQVIIRDLTTNQTLSDLRKKIAFLAKIQVDSVSVLYGYPQRPLDISDLNVTIGESGIRTGDTLIVQEKFVPLIASSGTTNINIQGGALGDTMSKPPNQSDDYESLAPGKLVRQIVPADNSCLFTSIGFVMTGKIDLTSGPYMRQIIAVEVSASPEDYTTAILGRPNNEYCDWIMLDESWGGAIELAVMSRYYGMEIAVVDTLNGIINRFGEDQAYGQRVFLVFDGIHYDPLYLRPNDGGSPRSIFRTNDDLILQTAAELAFTEKAARKYTDVKNFTLKCNDCGMQFIGQQAAQEHAIDTRHTSFGEIPLPEPPSLPSGSGSNATESSKSNTSKSTTYRLLSED